VGESFVDLTYRGLPLGRRIKLTQIRPSTGYLEHPTPMPVGTRIAIATDEGVGIDAVVMQIHEQVGGSDQPPGMTIAPALAEGAPASWWKERVALPELAPPPPPQGGAVLVLPRTRTVESPPPAGAEERADDAGGTMRMPAIEEPAPGPVAAAEAAESARVTEPTQVVAQAEDAGEGAQVAQAPQAREEPELPAAGGMDPDLLEQLAGSADGPIVDDGKQTVMMQSVDLSALGLEAGASGQFSASAIEIEIEESEPVEGEGEGEAAEEAADASPGNSDPHQPAATPERKKPGRKRKKRR